MAAALVCAMASCAPVDEVPSPDAEKQARIRQLGAVLAAAGEGRAPDVEALVQRLENLCRFPPAESASRALAQAIVAGLSGTSISRAAADQLALQLYAAMNGGYLPRPRLARLTDAIERNLLQSHISGSAAAAVRHAAHRVAREPRDPRTDWW